jgi:protein-tyrosine phosphatase
MCHVSTWFRIYGFADVLDSLFIGAYPLDSQDVAMLERIGVQRVLNLVEEEEYRAGEREEVIASYADAGIVEERLELTDFSTIPASDLDEAVSIVSAWLDQGARAYIHCRAGWQRSAAVAAAVIAQREGIDVDDALAYVQRRKPSADPLPHQREDLRRWWSARVAGTGTPER